MIRRPPRSTLDRSSAASDVYKRQIKIPMPVVLEGGGLPKLSNNWAVGIEDLNFTLIELTPTTDGI